MVWLTVILGVFIFQVGTILLLEFRDPAKSVAWLFILFLVPILGFVVYYFVARDYKQRRRIRRINYLAGNQHTHPIHVRQSQVVWERKDLHHRELASQHRLFRLLQAMPDSPITGCNQSLILTNADHTYQAMLESIRGAKKHIHLEFYIIRHDRIGTIFQQLLIEKAKEGVEVRLIYDGLGSYELEEQYIRDLKEAGVECYSFLPVFFAFFDRRMNYRNHRKILVVDGQVGYVGGINIGDEYLGGDSSLGFWRDTHIEIQGDSVYHLQHIFLTDWEFVSEQTLTEAQRFYPPHTCEGEEQIQLVSSGPDTHWAAILEVYYGAINAAKERVYLETPYFIPDPSIIMALKTAAVSGVDVRIIFPGVMDSKIVHWASLSYIEDLMQSGVRFYQYQKGFMHAKTIIVDHTMASVGTANMDMRSFFSNFELNALLFDRSSIKRLEQDFLMDLSHSKEFELAVFHQRPKWQRAMEVVCRLLSPLL